MLDIKYIRENKKSVEKAIINKGIKLNLTYLLDLDDKRRVLKQEVDELRKKRNEITQKVMEGDKNLIKSAKEVKALISQVENKYRRVENEYKELMLYVPQLPSVDTPVGEDESSNKVIGEFGEKPKFDFKPKDHIALGKNLGLLDIEKGAKVSGFRGYYLLGDLVLLHMGVLMYALTKMIEKGFKPMLPPTLTKDFALYGTGWFPFDKDNIYKAVPAGKLKLEEEKAEGTNLIGTSEVSLLSYFSDDVLEEKDLPVRVCGITQCYRSEIGSYRKDTKGIYRVREFSKVEQVVLCRNDYDESSKWLEELRKISEEILKDLELPYRVVQNCTGEMGAGKYKMYDIETWMAERGKYGETHSDSNLGDWQARRLKIRYRTKSGKKKFVHTLNNTAIASPRILIAILENNQQKDGSVKIPKVLQNFVGKEVLSVKK